MYLNIMPYTPGKADEIEVSYSGSYWLPWRQPASHPFLAVLTEGDICEPTQHKVRPSHWTHHRRAILSSHRHKQPHPSIRESKDHSISVAVEPESAIQICRPGYYFARNCALNAKRLPGSSGRLKLTTHVCLMDRAPDLFLRQRHIEVAHAQVR
jgi:hypothetical protein